LYPIDVGPSSSRFYLKSESEDRLPLQCCSPYVSGESHSETGDPAYHQVISDIDGDKSTVGTNASLHTSSHRIHLETFDDDVTQCDVKNIHVFEGACPKHEHTVTGDEHYSPPIDQLMIPICSFETLLACTESSHFTEVFR
jgi:hypothetical protein